MDHKSIPDSERHELKGASSAQSGQVPVSNGDGTTTFKTLDLTNLTGSVPAGVAGLHLVTDGLGGLAVTRPSYARFTITVDAGGIPTAIVKNFSSDDFVEDGVGAFSTSVGGVYLVTTEDPTTPYPQLKDVATGVAAFNGLTGLVNITADAEYTLTTSGSISLTKVN